MNATTPDAGTVFFAALETYVHERSAAAADQDQLALLLPVLAHNEVIMANWPIFTDEYATAQLMQDAILEAMDARYGGPSSDLMTGVRAFLDRASRLPSLIPTIRFEDDEQQP